MDAFTALLAHCLFKWLLAAVPLAPHYSIDTNVSADLPDLPDLPDTSLSSQLRSTVDDPELFPVPE